MWREFPAELASATGCAALTYSRYGNGGSEPLHEARPVSYMHDEALVVLPQVFAAYGIVKPILIGHSDGASIALIYAGAHPAALRAAIVLAPHLFVEDISIRSIAAIRDTYESTGLRSRLARYHRDVDRTFYGWNRIWLDPAFRSWNIREFTRRIEAPVLAIAGENDEYGTLAQLEALREDARGPVDCLALARCGHAPHRDRTELVTTAAAAFITSLSTQR
jgi:pimeloyl-ACP methyl ester carboxylesterase